MLCKESGQNLCDSYIEMNLSLKETKNNYWYFMDNVWNKVWLYLRWIDLRQHPLKQQGLDSSIKEVWCKIWQTKIAALNTNLKIDRITYHTINRGGLFYPTNKG